MLHQIKKFRILLVLPAAVLFLGTTGFMLLEKLSFLDALYFTIVTVSTVGYGDIYPITTAGKLFAMLLIFTGIGTFLTIVTRLTQLIVHRGRDRLRKQRLNMLIGVFFTEVGTQLLRHFVEYDPNISSIRQELGINENWSEVEFTALKRQLRRYKYSIDPKLMELEKVSKFLKEKGDLLLRQIENPDLIEYEALSELLWAVVHLRDEFMSRRSLSDLPEPDLAHLANDATRAYGHLVKEWLEYLQHMKRRYPYLYSLAIRTNPFSENPSAIIK
ncbi:MAG: potassium channel family protein [Dehalococcoidia bacterium]|nr:potassium channel family protein [Dehalococcoidia bacterium]MDZ4246718.1 potassium channel family protein [Dehalococcoidia bacterium]